MHYAEVLSDGGTWAERGEMRGSHLCLDFLIEDVLAVSVPSQRVVAAFLMLDGWTQGPKLAEM